MLCFSACVAGSFALGVLVANDIAPLALTAIRFWLATFLIGIAALASRKLDREACQAPWRYVLLGGLFAIYFVLMFEGLKTATSISTAAVFTLTPILSGIFGWILLRQITTPRMAMALSIGAVGALWVIFRGNLGNLYTMSVGQGELIFFVGCIAHAAYTPLIRRLNRGETALVFTFGTLLAGSLVLTVAGWSDLRQTEWHALPILVWLTLAYLVVFSTALSFLFVQYATLRLPSAKVMAYTYLVPSWVILWDLALARGAPPMSVLTGIGLSVLALCLLLRNE